MWTFETSSRWLLPLDNTPRELQGHYSLRVFPPRFRFTFHVLVIASCQIYTYYYSPNAVKNVQISLRVTKPLMWYNWAGKWDLGGILRWRQKFRHITHTVANLQSHCVKLVVKRHENSWLKVHMFHVKICRLSDFLHYTIFMANAKGNYCVVGQDALKFWLLSDLRHKSV